MKIRQTGNNEFEIEDQIEEYKALLTKMMSEKRFVHSQNVMETAKELAKVHDVDLKKATIAGLLHDCAREMSEQDLITLLKEQQIQITEIELARPVLLHAAAGSILAREKFGINDKEILSAIACHTTGKADMNDLDAIIYLADYIEPGRKFTGVEQIRDLAYNDLWNAMRNSMAQTIIHIGKKGLHVHKDTIDAYNWLLKEKQG